MKSLISDLSDAVFEQGEDVVKAVKKDVIKGIPQAAKQQILDQKDEKITDPVTGKPVPSKKAMSDLTKATGQLQMAKIKKIREELEKQRLKVTDKKAELAPIESAKKAGQGPEMAQESAERPADNAVAQTLKGSKSTGEFKGLVGG